MFLFSPFCQQYFHKCVLPNSRNKDVDTSFKTFAHPPRNHRVVNSVHHTVPQHRLKAPIKRQQAETIFQHLFVKPAEVRIGASGRTTCSCPSCTCRHRADVCRETKHMSAHHGQEVLDHRLTSPQT